MKERHCKQILILIYDIHVKSMVTFDVFCISTFVQIMGKMNFLYRRFWQFLVIIYVITLAAAQCEYILFICLKHYRVCLNTADYH